MEMRWAAVGILAWLLASPAWAYQLHVRTDDPGLMWQVDADSPEIAIDTVLDFADTSIWQTALNTPHGTIRWGASLAGLEEGCMLAPNNTWPGGVTTWWRSGVNGTLNRGTVHGSPTVPLRTQGRADGGGVFQYHTFAGRVSLTYNNTCRSWTLNGQTYGASWGGSSWAMVFDKPRTAFSMTVVVPGDTVGERYHVEFWGVGGEKVGHQDIVDSPVNPTGPQTFAWVSEVPVAAMSGWPQNAPGMWFMSIGLGHATGAEEPVCSCPCECGG